MGGCWVGRRFSGPAPSRHLSLMPEETPGHCGQSFRFRGSRSLWSWQDLSWVRGAATSRRRGHIHLICTSSLTLSITRSDEEACEAGNWLFSPVRDAPQASHEVRIWTSLGGERKDPDGFTYNLGSRGLPVKRYCGSGVYFFRRGRGRAASPARGEAAGVVFLSAWPRQPGLTGRRRAAGRCGTGTRSAGSNRSP